MSSDAHSTSPAVGLIWAQTPQGVIGADGDMPWHLPEDFAHFKETTVGCPVIMGRATWESLPPKNRPLPGRVNIVLTRSHEFSAPGAHLAHTVEEALETAQEQAAITDASHIWVIGGGHVYRQFLDSCDVIEVTVVDVDIAGDTYAPHIPPTFEQAQRRPQADWLMSKTSIPYAFHTYRRKGETA